MVNNIIFLGPNDINKLKTYQGMPTVAALKNDVITDLFLNTITNPSFTTEIEDDGMKITITIATDTELNDALQHLKEGQSALRIRVQEKAAAIISPWTRPHPILGGVGTVAMPKVNAQFVKHVTIDEENNKESSIMSPGTRFIKTWKLKNNGGLQWPERVTLLFVSKMTGDAMGGPDELPIQFPERVAIGKEVDISVPLIAPEKPGEYTGFWKLADENRKKFGPRVRVRITVK